MSQQALQYTPPPLELLNRCLYMCLVFQKNVLKAKPKYFRVIHSGQKTQNRSLSAYALKPNFNNDV